MYGPPHPISIEAEPLPEGCTLEWTERGAHPDDDAGYYVEVHSAEAGYLPFELNNLWAEDSYRLQVGEHLQVSVTTEQIRLERQWWDYGPDESGGEWRYQLQLGGCAIQIGERTARVLAHKAWWFARDWAFDDEPLTVTHKRLALAQRLRA